MAPAASKLRAEADVGAFPRRALAQYLRLLRLYPVLTKATTSGILSALGNFLAQLIEKNQEKEDCSQKLDVRGPLSYAIYRAAGSLLPPLRGDWIPPEAPSAGVTRLLLGRLLFAPAFLSSFFLIVNSLEVGLCHVALMQASSSLDRDAVVGMQRLCELYTQT
ncbi:peroxisomal membrane protein 2 isoform X1 [Delphinus delphis]|uniref:peroxisomal membrane protein 2 isoform X1 n=1 Tax=Delphinus delphis TaxID=9728 RepID=UPI0028C38185|nr:peroxisomal membrane protein 2 isoform X1 [Delphinus delphis]